MSIVLNCFNNYSYSFFFLAGMNAIVLYMGHEVLNGRFPVQWSVTPEHPSELAMASWGTAFWTFVAAMLFTKKIFISI